MAAANALCRKVGLVALWCALRGRLSGLLALPILAVTLAPAPAHCEAAARSEILVVAAMHGLHARSPGYSYERLYRLVEAFRPDFVGVEIRQEDLRRDEAYQRRNYPREMVDLVQRYGGRAFGVDWLGDDFAGRAMPENWAQTHPLKQLERELAQDARMDRSALERIRGEQRRIFENVTPASLNDGRYDLLSADYYRAFRRMVEDTRYGALSTFYAERDRRIGENIAAMIAANPGRRFVIVLGADHRGPAIAYLTARFGQTVGIATVADPPP